MFYYYNIFRRKTVGETLIAKNTNTENVFESSNEIANNSQILSKSFIHNTISSLLIFINYF